MEPKTPMNPMRMLRENRRRRRHRKLPLKGTLQGQGANVWIAWAAQKNHAILPSCPSRVPRMGYVNVNTNAKG
jgi:hypothetical protein